MKTPQKKQPGHRPGQSRHTLAQRIWAELPDVSKALEIASEGRQLSEVERQCDLLLFMLHQRERVVAKGQSAAHEERKSYAAAIDRCSQCLSVAVLDAIGQRNTTMLRRLADFVDAWQYARPDQDPRRAHVLALKQILDERRETMPLAMLAALLNRRFAGDPLIVPPSDDGHSQLRRLAKQLKFPLAEGKTNKPNRKASKS